MTKLDALIPIVRAAGEKALLIYQSDFAVNAKDDHSPVTQADLLVDAMIAPELARLFPDIHVVSEENAASHQLAAIRDNLFFLVDPIDGTKEFVNKTGEFTVNIALIKQSIPIAGIVYAPFLGRFFIADTTGAFELKDQEKQRIEVADCVEDGVTAVASRSHFDPQTAAFLDQHDVKDVVSVGSSLKFCTLATGEADIYPRFGPTMEWDTAAGHAILKAAGGDVLTIDGAPLAYGKPEFRNPYFFACSPSARIKCGI